MVFGAVMMVEKDWQEHGRKGERERSNGCRQPHTCPAPAVLLGCGDSTVHANDSEGSLGDKREKMRKLIGRKTNDKKAP